MTEGFRGWLSGWEDFRVEVEEYRELDEERALLLSCFSGRGKSSGLDIRHMRAMGAGLFTVRDGKVTRYVLYWDRERAFADLGLDPKAVAPGS